jgi:hypothetical protein
MTGDEHVSPVRRPVPDVGPALSRAAWLRRRLIMAAEAVAESEDQVAATLARMADQRPHDAARLLARSEAAARTAESERRWAADCLRSIEDEPAVPPAVTSREGTPWP